MKPTQTGFEIPITNCTAVTQHIMCIHVILKRDHFNKGSRKLSEKYNLGGRGGKGWFFSLLFS